MRRRLAIIGLVMIFLMGIGSQASAQGPDDLDTRTLKGISAVLVLVEDLDGDGAKTLGLTTGAIRTDVELKLRLAGMRVVTRVESFSLSGGPYLYINVNVLPSPSRTASISVELHQNTLLERNGERAIGVTTWDRGTLISNPNAQGIRNSIKDKVDEFLNDWLSVNPKK